MTVAPGTAVGKAGEQRRHPRHVAVVLARLVGRAEVDVGDPLGVDAAALDHGPDRVGGEVVGADRGERATVGADRSSDRVDYVGLGHGPGLNSESGSRRPGAILARWDSSWGRWRFSFSWSACCSWSDAFIRAASADLLDWQPTRSPEVEVQNEIDDVRQMLEAQNEMRRRRGAPEMTEEDLRERVDEEERDRLRWQGPFGAA